MRQAPRWRARSSRARRPTSSPPPISTGWTTVPAKAIRDDTRVNSRQQARADRTEGFQVRVLQSGRTRSRQARRRWPHRDRRRQCGAGRQVRKSALEKLGSGVGAEQVRDGGKWRAALALVARGEAVLGIVYETEAKVSGVKIRAFPPDSHPAIVYPSPRPRTPSRKPWPISLSCVARPPRRCSSSTASRSWCGRRRKRNACFPSPPTMDRGPSFAAHRAGGDRGGAAVRIAIACLLARKEFLGKALLDGIVHCRWCAAGRHRLSAADRVRPARLIGPFLADTSASCSRSAGPARRSPAA